MRSIGKAIWTVLTLLLATTPAATAGGHAAFEVRLEAPPGADAHTGDADRFEDHGVALWLEHAPVLTGVDLAEAHAGRDEFDRPDIEFTLTQAGAQRFAAATTANVGKRMGIVLRGKLISAPAIGAPITDGKVEVTGLFSENEARDLAAEIQGAVLSGKGD